jgi:hypothetical protein
MLVALLFAENIPGLFIRFLRPTLPAHPSKTCALDNYPQGPKELDSTSTWSRVRFGQFGLDNVQVFFSAISAVD